MLFQWMADADDLTRLTPAGIAPLLEVTDVAGWNVLEFHILGTGRGMIDLVVWGV